MTRRNPPPDLATPTTSSSRPWLAARSRLRVSLLGTDTPDSSGTSTRQGTSLTGFKRRRLNPSLVLEEDQDVDTESRTTAPADAFLRRMMAYTPAPRFLQASRDTSTPVPVMTTLPEHGVDVVAGTNGVNDDFDDHNDDDFDDNNDDDEFNEIDDDTDDDNNDNDDDNGDNNDEHDDGDNATAGDDVSPGEVPLTHDRDVAMADHDPDSAVWTLFFDGAFRRRSRRHGAGAGAGATLFHGTANKWNVAFFLQVQLTPAILRSISLLLKVSVGLYIMV